jgi:CNT family concentrative nucleoside transporter
MDFDTKENNGLRLTKSFEFNVRISELVDQEASFSAEKPLYGKRSLQTFIIDASLWLLASVYATLMIMKGSDKGGYEIAMIIYLIISLRLIARHISISQLIYDPISQYYKTSLGSYFSTLHRTGYGYIVTAIPFVVTFVGLVFSALTFPLSEGSSIIGRFQSLFGLIVLIGLMYVTSSNKAAIPWHTVGSGLLMQFLIAILVLRTTIGLNVIKGFSNLIGKSNVFLH